MKPEELESNLFKTDPKIANAVARRVNRDFPRFQNRFLLIGDAGADEGVWGKAAKKIYPDSYLVGYESRIVTPTPACFNEWAWGDFLKASENRKFDLIFSNPPYSIDEAFCDKACRMLRHGGLLVALMRLDMLGSDTRYRTFWATEENPCGLPLRMVYTLVERIPFIKKDGVKKTPSGYHAIFVFEKGYSGRVEAEWLSWHRG